MAGTAARREARVHASKTWASSFWGRRTIATANVWGQLKAKWDRAGLNVPALDDQIAATAHRRGVVVITRNVRDFEGTGVQVHNPFEG